VQTYLLVAFALAALLLSAIGIYGVLSFTVASRKQEIGVRLALGASRRQIFGLTLGGVSLPVIAGLVLGFGASLAASGAIQRVQFGTAGLDAWLVGGVAIVFLTTASLAGWLPARRAAQTDPLESLRAD
jgi:putative ABC transport system permease protein